MAYSQVDVSCVPGRFICTNNVSSGMFFIQSQVLEYPEQPVSVPGVLDKIEH